MMTMRNTLAAGLALCLLAGTAPAHPVVEVESAPVAQASPLVVEATTAPYLTEDERRDARVFHGLWELADLADPARRARAALIAGVWDDESLFDDSIPALLRAEGMIARGELAGAVEALGADDSVRAQRLRAEALEGLGRFDDADEAVGPVVAAFARRELTSAPDLVDAVRAMRVRSRVRGLPAADYRAMMGLLGRARNADPLYWPAALEEARLLHAKDNFREAGETLAEAVTLCPRSAGVLDLSARMSVQSFNFDRTEALAALLDDVARAVDPARTSPVGPVHLAQAMLRQNDPDMAEELLTPVLERFPQQRDAAAVGCAIAAVRYDRRNTESALAAFDELSPGSPLALYTAGRAMSENRQYERAAELLERAVERQPNWPPPIVALGLLHVQAANDADATRWLTRAVELDPFQRRARNSLEMLEGLAAFGRLESDHFIVRYEPGVDEVLAREMLPVLERIHERVAGEFEHEPSRKTVIELMPDHEWFAVRITGMPAIHTIAAATGPLIAMEAPKIGPNHTGVYDWPRVLQHEYAHTITLSRTNNRIPHWFTEAAAVNVEDAPRDYDTCRLLAGALAAGGLFDMREINIAFVRPKKPTDRGQAYAQGAWMYEYIKHAHGADAPLQLMDLYAQGVREESAMREVLGITRDEFYANFVEWARGDVRAWGMNPIPTMNDLRFEITMSDPDARDTLHEALRASADRVAVAMHGAGALQNRPLPMSTLEPHHVSRLLSKYPEHPGLLELAWRRAVADAGDELNDDAVLLLQRYADARPVDPEPHRLLARWFLDRGDRQSLAHAVEHLAYLDAREQNTAVFASERARRLAELGRLEESAEAAERAVRITPYDADERELAASAALRLGDYAAAHRHILALTELEPAREIHRRRLDAVRSRMGDTAADPG